MTGSDINTYLLKIGLTQREFAERLNLSQPHVSRWIKSNTSLNNASVSKILEVFPDFYDNVSEKSSKYDNSGESKSSVMKESKTLYNTPRRLNVLDVNDLEDFMNGKGPTKGEIDVSDFIEATAGMMMKGDEMGGSMTINGGDVLAHKEWYPRTYYDYGKVHIVCTRDHMFIRYLKKHEEKDKVLLRAKNEFYDDIDLPISEISKLFVVNGALVRS